MTASFPTSTTHNYERRQRQQPYKQQLVEGTHADTRNQESHGIASTDEACGDIDTGHARYGHGESLSWSRRPTPEHPPMMVTSAPACKARASRLAIKMKRKVLPAETEAPISPKSNVTNVCVNSSLRVGNEMRDGCIFRTDKLKISGSSNVHELNGEILKGQGQAAGSCTAGGSASDHVGDDVFLTSRLREADCVVDKWVKARAVSGVKRGAPINSISSNSATVTRGRASKAGGRRTYGR